MEREDRIEGILTHFERQYQNNSSFNSGIPYICLGLEKHSLPIAIGINVATL